VVETLMSSPCHLIFALVYLQAHWLRHLDM
jgi:hypothetical protein